MTAKVVIESACREAYGAPNVLPVGAFFQAASGEVVRVESDGRLERLVRGGQAWGRSVASDPAARRGA